MNRMTRKTGWWVWAVAAGIAALLLSAAVSAIAAEQKKPGKVYHFSAKDLKPFETGGGNGMLVAYIEQPDITAGMVRFEKGKYELKEWPYWYEEVLYVTRGKGKITISPAPQTHPEPHDVVVGDILYVPKGAKVSFEATTEEPFDLFYVTAPNPGLE